VIWLLDGSKEQIALLKLEIIFIPNDILADTGYMSDLRQIEERKYLLSSFHSTPMSLGVTKTQSSPAITQSLILN
jgi:hypothetical protein